MSAHVHAENMRLYAEDAAETDSPWVRWEFSSDGRSWKDVSHPVWMANLYYRRKPKTVTIGGLSLDEQDINEACTALDRCGREDIAEALIKEFNK